MKNNNYRERTNIYSKNDSAITFMLALIIPQVLMLLAVFLCSSITGLPMASADSSVKTFVDTYPFVYTLLCALVPQISFVIVFIFISEKRKVNYKTANQINFKINPLVLVCVIAIGLVAMFGFSPLINMFDKFTSNLGYKSSTSNIDISTFWKFFASIFYIGLLPAICEELIFRGIITNGLRKYGKWTAIIFSAVFFALIHQNLQQLIYQLFLGGIMAYIVIKTGSIIYTMILHFFNNFIILLMAYLNGDTPNNIDYSNAWNVIYPILLVIAAMGIIIGLLFLISYIIKNSDTKKAAQTQFINNKEDATDNNLEIKNQKSIDELLKFQVDETVMQSDNFMKNIYMIIAVAGGIVFWIFSVVSSFK